jgi:hypothetical protein
MTLLMVYPPVIAPPFSFLKHTLFTPSLLWKIGRGATEKNVQINTAVLILRGYMKIELQN